MNIGGQAVIEGVMMRGKQGFATVVRRKDRSLEKSIEKYVSYSSRYRVLGWPVLRGAVALIESLVIGMKTLSWSADIAIEDEESEDVKNKKKDRDGKEESLLYKIIPILFAVIIGIGVFMALPYYIIGVIPVTKEANPLIFNLTAGLIRIIFFLTYIYAISFLEDVKRLFEYHGAEHQVIACHEHGEKVTAKNAMKYSTCHARCGTSFLLVAAISCIIVFAVIDAIIGSFWSAYLTPPWYLRVSVHLPLIPLVSGLSYEFLRFTGKYDKNPLVHILALPGIWLQMITTKRPDKDQLEVAIASLDEVMKLEKSSRT